MKKDKKIAIRVRGIILHENKLLVVKHPHDLSYYALPGGVLEFGEDVRGCMRREILEELGVESKVGKLLYINNFVNKDSVQSIEFFFEIVNSVDFLDVSRLKGTHTYEIAEIKWISVDEKTPIYPKILGEDFKVGKVLSQDVRFIYQA